MDNASKEPWIFEKLIFVKLIKSRMRESFIPSTNTVSLKTGSKIILIVES